MPMQMGWRWYGEGNDPITLNDIKQIPGVSTIVWALHHKMPGEICLMYPRPVYRKLQAVHPQPVQVWR